MVESEWVMVRSFSGVAPTRKNLRTLGSSFWGGAAKSQWMNFSSDVLTGIGASVAAQDGGSVVGGVEADAEQVRAGVEVEVGGEKLVEFGEVAAHARAVVGERAARIDEGDEQDLAAELRDVDELAALVEQLEVGDGVAGIERLVGDGRLVVGLGLADDDDVVECALGLRGEEVGGDGVSGVELADDAGVPEGIGHDHGFHVAGDGVGVESDGAFGGVGGDDDSADVVGLSRR